ncbi:hypothetical protein HID58_075244 [Brassica napus]|uniref:Uncharacterized protein n=1 Tax=Brassica napus TaxID=3708 RepID=A0ABQ7YJC7_BRANA|nr:hypothetical protein HID58_075244 [Brassica napus]
MKFTYSQLATFVDFIDRVDGVRAALYYNSIHYTVFLGLIFEWMEKKKMKFTPSQIATFVDFIDRVHGVRVALDYFESVDPDFDNMD